MAIKASNNPDMLRWAREDAGLTIEEAARALKLSVDRLTQAEGGNSPLTLTQLREAASAYGFPFGYFYLNSPPGEIKYRPPPDYRVDPRYIGVSHPRLNLEIKKCLERREIYLELASTMKIPLKQFVKLQDKNHTDIGKKIRHRLAVTQKELDQLSIDQVYPYWKEKIETDGVLVYESQYIPEETGVIGVSLYFEEYPIILIKRGASFSKRKLFTLLHEYSHLLIGESGIVDERALETVRPTNQNTIEFRCNNIAAQILIPESEFRPDKYRAMIPQKMMEALGGDFKVTYSTAAVYLAKFGLITADQLDNLLKLRYEAYKEEQKNKKQGPIKIPRENINRLDMGKPFFDLALSAYSSGVLNVYEASEVLNLRVSKIDHLIARTKP